VPEKKIKKKVTKRCITPIFPAEVPLEIQWIVTKFSMWGRPADLINCAKF